MLSPADELAALPEAERNKFIESLTEDAAQDLLHDWRGFLARPDQVAPDGDWEIWLVLSGRGWGKTRTGAEWIKERVELGEARRIAFVAETAADGRDVMVEGDSGILSIYPIGHHNAPLYEPSKRRLTWPNGAVATIYNATEPDQLRGPQHDTAWSDELAKWKYARETWDQLQFGLRLGNHPRQLVTTTPRPIELVKAILAGHEGKVHTTRGRTLDNKTNLATSFVERIEKRYGGTRLGRQELDGEVLGDMPGALWRLQDIDVYRVQQMPTEMGRTLVAVDPATTNEEDSDYHGVVVAGIKGDEGFVLEDGSIQGTPLDWANRAIALHDHYQADGVVVETNQGGDMVAHTLRSVRANLNIIEVWASKGKHVRAEPIAALYQQGRVHHVGSFPELETQMTMTTNAGYEGEGSPDRLDACVWALSALFPEMTYVAPKAKAKTKKQSGETGWMRL